MDFWQTQSPNKPLFEDLLWSRPETKARAGKLLIIGGHEQEFAQTAAAYQTAYKAGAGTVKAILPASLHKVASAMPGIEFAPANQSGSFSRAAVAEWLDHAGWADAVLLAGDLGKNSETTAALDSFLAKNDKLTVISDNALDSIDTPYKQLTDMPVDLTLSFKHVQKLGSGLHLKKPFVSNMVNNVMAELLSTLSQNAKASFIVQNEGQVWVASRGRVTNTKLDASLNEIAAYCAVWHMQHAAKPLEALTSACHEARS